jgi:agmatinase
VLHEVDRSKLDVDGAGDPSGSIFGLPYDEDECSLVLVPVPWEPTTSYGGGAAGGPEAIRAASPQLDLFDPELAELGIAEPWIYGIHMLDENPTVRAWNDEACRLARRVREDGPNCAEALAQVNARSNELNAWVSAQAEALLARGKIVGIVGGDHSVPFGAITAHAKQYPGLGILHVDAHADLRERYEGFAHSHASIMRNVIDAVDDLGALVQVGVRDVSRTEYETASAHPRISTWYDHAITRRLAHGDTWGRLCDEIVGGLPQHVWISFDIDGLDPSLCPSTGTPVPGGLSFGAAMTLCSTLLRCGKTVVGFDLVEVASSSVPNAQPSSQWDGNVGARMLYRLCGVAIGSRLPVDSQSIASR